MVFYQEAILEVLCKEAKLTTNQITARVAWNLYLVETTRLRRHISRDLSLMKRKKIINDFSASTKKPKEWFITHTRRRLCGNAN